MKLILFRHGLAVERDVFQRTKKDDALRPLVPKGKLRTQGMGHELAKWLEFTDIIVTSPYLRAKQTAQILKPILRPKKFMEAVELIPSAPPSAFALWLKANASLATSIVVVGHEPQLDIFATWCLSGQHQSFIKIKKSGALGIEVDSFQDIAPMRSELRFMTSPQMFD